MSLSSIFNFCEVRLVLGFGHDALGKTAENLGKRTGKLWEMASTFFQTRTDFVCFFLLGDASQG
jgi:hypothetical protein